MINLPLLIVTLITIIIGIFLSRKQTVLLTDFRKVERRLVWQTITSSVFLILYYATQYVGGIIYDQNPDAGNQLYELSGFVYALHTYPAIVILFIVR